LSPPFRLRQIPIASALAASLVFVAGAAAPRALLAQASSSSSSSGNPQEVDTTPGPRIAQPEAAGSAITLETSEPLFYLAASLNACGYDNDLAASSPVRARVRDEINEELAGSAPARDARDALCAFIRNHALNDRGRDLAQYVSLSLYLGPPPLLTPTADLTDLPVDAAQVAEVLPLVRTFAEAVHLNAQWGEHRGEYDGFVDRIHEPLTRAVLDTNIYLHLPVSSYDGRRLLVLLEPMLAPSETNARIYGNDYIVVVSPTAQAAVPMDLIRHTYLHYLIEPMVYSRPAAMDRLLPLLKQVQDAPLEFSYKADIASLLTECLIKAVEDHLMDVGVAHPVKPATRNDRSELERYDAQMSVYDRQADAVRRKAVALEMRQGWVLVEYFYDELTQLEKSGTSLKDAVGPMVYGMDVASVQHRNRQIVFLPTGSGSGDPAFRGAFRHTPRQLTGLDLAALKLSKGDVNGAGDLADAALKTNPSDAQAHYLLGRIDLMQGHPEDAQDHLTQTVQLSHDPRTAAWAHIYLGRLYDLERDPNNPDAPLPQRDKAIAEYKAALAHRDSQPDTKAAAEKGIKERFTLPRRTAASSDEQRGNDAPVDPTGKAEKEAYKPPPLQ
jgi:tetratricopeptide (TPR) repeat protein